MVDAVWLEAVTVVFYKPSEVSDLVLDNDDVNDFVGLTGGCRPLMRPFFTFLCIMAWSK